MKYLITIQYDGSNFYGFQRQNNKRTVQNEIEKALTIINKAAVEIKGAGRTDKGVHAYGQKACFNLNVNVPVDRLKKALNDILPVDIYIVDCEMVEEFFRAFCVAAGVTLHINVYYGKNDHHKVEAIFKAFGRALKQAVKIESDKIPSSKGVLE